MKDLDLKDLNIVFEYVNSITEKLIVCIYSI